MQEQTSTYPETLIHPRMFDVFFHLMKTVKLIGALLTDQRVPLLRKIGFVGSIIFLLVLLIFPDIFGEFVTSTLLPFIGILLGVPIDAGFDWLAFALALVGLLRVFPAELVAEHYRRIFQRH